MERRWRVGIVGINSLGLFLLERLKLYPRFQVVVAAEPDENRLALAKGFANRLSNQLDVVLTEPLDCVVFAGCGSEEVLERIVSSGKSVVIAQPWRWSFGAMERYGEIALSPRQFVTTFCPHRWSSDVLSASAAMSSGRLGKIRSARLSIAELGLTDDGGAEKFLTEQSFHFIDQLLLFVDSKPVQVFATATTKSPDHDKCGRIVIVEFADGCVAQIDLQFDSRLGYRSGWALEGDQGSYRNHRLYTTTSAGEVIDEPIAITNPSDDGYFDQLDRRFLGQQVNLPTLTQSIRVVQLIEFIEQSASTGRAVRW